MIQYNFRYRGPFEYDKFVLNALQLRNQVNHMLKQDGLLFKMTSNEQVITEAFEKADADCYDAYIASIDYWGC